MKSFLKMTLFMVTICYLVGGQWAVLQAIAWGKMLNDYSREQSFTVAVVQTFDGEHPCELCLSIQTRKMQEESTPVTPPEALEKVAKCIAYPSSTTVLVDHPTPWIEAEGFAPPRHLNQQWIQAPSSPPPKVLA